MVMVVEGMKRRIGDGEECDSASYESVRVIEEEPNMTHSRLMERDRMGKMSRLHQNRSSKSVQRIDFKFSRLKALQVPKGWDKLFVSVITTENCKTIAKSSKVQVRNGGCQWTDTISESIWVSRNSTSKDIEHCLLKLLVAKGSPRSDVLGEATVNVTNYMNSSAAVPLSIPLNKCNHGTVLHVTLQCLTAREKFRSQGSRERYSQIKALNADNLDVAVRSNESNHSYVQSVESPSIKDLDSTSSSLEVESRATSFSGPGSHCSYKSAEGSIRSGNISRNIYSREDGESPTGKQDSISSQKNLSHYNYPFSDSSQSNPSSFNSHITASGSLSCMQEFCASSSSVTKSSRICLEGVEDTMDEFRAEAKMWEINARKLMVDLDTTRAEFSEQSQNLANLRVELSESNIERDNLRREVEQLKQSLEDLMVKEKALEDSLSQGECVPEVEKALKDELRFQKESHANLSLQLERSQEANFELLSVLQELEKTIEQQKIELENRSALSLTFSDLENSLQLSIEANRNSLLQPEQVEEEGASEIKKLEIGNVGSINNKVLLDIKTEYESKLSAKEGELSSLKAKLSEALDESCGAETISRNEGDADLLREIAVLRGKVQELEMDCNELTEENLELLFKLKQANNYSRNVVSEDFLANKLKDQNFASFESEVSNDAFHLLHLEDMLDGNNENSDCVSIQELQSLKAASEIRITELSKEVTDKTSEMANLEAKLLSKERKIEVLQNRQIEWEAKICQFENEKIQLEEDMEVLLKERDINTKCLYDLQNDLGTLSRSLDSHVSANEILRRNSLELENGKHELELYISDIEQEKEQLSMRISVLEAELRDLTTEKDSSLSELENSRSHASRLQEVIMNLKSEMDSSIENLEEKLKVTQYQWSEAQQECEYLSRANEQSQTAIENLAQECNFLQKLNEDLRKQKQELQESCSVIGTRLRDSDQRFADCTERVELLENKTALILEDSALKEKSLTSELDVLLDENIRHIENGQTLLNELLMAKTAEIQNLQQKIEHLSTELSATYHEKERIASNATLEISALRADKAKLKFAFEEVQSESISTKSEINDMRADYEQKLQDLKTELTAFRNNQEMLMADHEKLLEQVEDYKSRELKVKSTMEALKVKLGLAEYERQQLMEESQNLTVQSQQIEKFENEIMALKNELNSANSEKERLVASLSVTSELYENLKVEKKLFEAKISTLENAVSELEDCRRSRESLKESLMQMGRDLKAKETLLAQEAEKKNEISHIKRINRHYHQTVRLLDKEKDELQTKVQALEEELKLVEEQKRNQVSTIYQKALPAHEDLENPMVKNTNQHHGIRKKPLLKNDTKAVNDQQYIPSGNYPSEAETEYGLVDESVHAVEADPVTKIQSLETELVKEANNMFEDQPNRCQSQDQNNPEASVRSTGKSETVTKERFERTKSMLEAELKDIQERYLHMSLKFAEVEAQREELVMKLKSAKNQKDVTL